MKNKQFSHIKSLINVLFLLFFGTIAYAQQFVQIQDISRLKNVTNSNGVAVADFDGDLDLDIFIVAKAKEISSEERTKSKLFRNNSNGTFTDVTEISGLVNLLPEDDSSEISGAGSDGFKNGVSWGDYDNDGFPDIFLTYSKKIQLFHNNGDGTFTDVTDSSGILSDNGCLNMGATWFDANNDGFLDLYITDWGGCTNNNFYINNGNGTFNNAFSQYFGSTPFKNSYMAIPFDFNSDGYMDLYVSQDFTEPNDLYINQNGNSFTQDAAAYGLDSKVDDMGMAIGDYNNDGFFDFYIAGINSNPLLKNNGDNTFTEVSIENNVNRGGWSWGPIFADFDLDRDEDIFVTNGFKFHEPIQESNHYFKNLYQENQNTFSDETSNFGFTDKATNVSPVAFDYDNDGDLDLLVTKSDKNIHFYENKIIDRVNGTNLNWLKVSLKGTSSNRNAIGAIVTLTTNNGELTRHNSSITHLSQSIKPIHFGLGIDTSITEIKINWPSGQIETYTNLESNQNILFTEGQGFETFNIPTVIKKMGCTDPSSCNYDPEAILDDGSCTYLTSNEITGNVNSGFLNTETYTYLPTSENSTFSWDINGGEIIKGFNTNSVIVKWSITDTGEITVRETNSECSNELVTLQVNLSASKLSNKHSIARLWNEALLTAIRGDFARPTVHARNLFHTSIALYDSWAIFDKNATTYLIGKKVHNFNSNFTNFSSNEPTEDAKLKAMSYAAYRLLSHRFKNSPTFSETQALFDFLMTELNYDISLETIDFSDGDAAALGNFIGKTIIDYGMTDGAREAENYDNAFYEPVNNALFPFTKGNPNLTDPNRWQPLSLNEFIDQSGNLIQNNKPDFLSPEWGSVNSFSLNDDVKNTFSRDGNNYTVYHDPSEPPYLDLNNNSTSSDAYKWGFSLVSLWGSHLDPTDNVLWDISPNSIGNIDFSNLPTTSQQYPNFYSLLEGGDIGEGRNINPSTNSPYETQLVPRGDYTRVLAEFWADGPDSETPPGHWFTLLNYVNDNELLVKKLNGEGDILNPLEWDVKSYFLMGGAMHDAAISAWSIKGWYDYIRPISAIRYMAQLGQSTDSTQDNYNVSGIPLREGFIEIVKAGDALEGRGGNNIGKIKLYTWRGPTYINNPATDNAGVGWILAENWWPYQRPNFVTPPFAGYVSGHSTYSRAAAEVMTLLTGDEYFPGGYGEFIARKNQFLVFEEGPSVDIKLQWATYRDASDQCSLSRIWGGIHPPADDIPGRLIGEKIGNKAFNFGVEYFNGEESTIVNPNENLSYIVFPNPIISQNVFVKNTLETDTYKVVDMLGRAIELKTKQYNNSTNITELTLPETLSAGIYVLTINKSSRLFIKE